jgi:hypothetical protein
MGAHYFPEDYRVIGKLIGADMNVTTDQGITIQGLNDQFTKYVVERIVVTNASISLTTAAGGVYTAASKSGAIVAAGQVYSALTAATKYVALTLTGASLTDVLTVSTIYLSLTTGQGAAATADVYIYGRLFQGA